MTAATTLERPVPFRPTSDESVEVFRALERYARGNLDERLAATEDMDRIIARVAARACEEMGCNS
jgi:hypothetical protein